jgi:hypothetical protein
MSLAAADVRILVDLLTGECAERAPDQGSGQAVVAAIDDIAQHATGQSADDEAGGSVVALAIIAPIGSAIDLVSRRQPAFGILRAARVIALRVIIGRIGMALVTCRPALVVTRPAEVAAQIIEASLQGGFLAWPVCPAIAAHSLRILPDPAQLRAGPPGFPAIERTVTGAPVDALLKEMDPLPAVVRGTAPELVAVPSATSGTLATIAAIMAVLMIKRFMENPLQMAEQFTRPCRTLRPGT